MRKTNLLAKEVSMKNGVRRVLLCALMVLAFQGISNGVIVSDSFDTGTPGDSIAGRVTDVGGTTWMVQNLTSAVIGSDGAVSSAGLSAASQASLVLRNPNRYQFFYLTADVLVSSSDDYVGLGFLPTTNCSDNWGNLGLPSLRLHPSGAWDLYGLTSGAISGFTADVYHTVQLVYHKYNQNVKFYMDGTLIKDQYIWQSSWINNNINAMGFRINSTTSGLSKIDNFAMNYTTDLASFPAVSQPNLSVSNASGSADVIVSNAGQGTLEWTAVSDSSWLTFSPASGTDTATMTLNYTENTAFAARTGIITITGNGQTATITVVQDATPLIPGDANGDGAVDVGDLGILAANYGTTEGATWELGDFNEDGAVDVGDLGILAANYGTGVSGADWDADYAKVFGSTAEADDTSSTMCGSLGLTLIAGLLLMGLMIVKLEK